MNEREVYKDVVSLLKILFFTKKIFLFILIIQIYFMSFHEFKI